MQRPGFIVRFVDVVLILLFGFISISNTSNSSLDLAESTELTPTPVDTAEVLFIGVLADGSFLVENEKVVLANLDEVETYLLQKQRLFSSMPFKVRIRSSRNAPVQSVFNIIDMCEKLGITSVLEIKVASGSR